MRRDTYIKIGEKEYTLVISKKAKQNGVYNFLTNVIFVIEECGASTLLTEDKKIVIRNEAFEYDVVLRLFSETRDAVILNFLDIDEKRQVDINFTLSSMIA